MKPETKFSKYTTDQLQSLLKTIRSQNIPGYTQQFGDEVEQYLTSRDGQKTK